MSVHKMKEMSNEVDYMNTYYVSLCRGLFGYYVKFTADSEDTVRKHCAEYFGRLWVSVYTEKPSSDRYKSIVINEKDPIELHDCWEWD